MSGLFYPYKLLITVIAAHNLPIADITSSDPYVTIRLGDKLLGRTKTVYRNRLNPKWDEIFVASLLHVNHVLELKVFDEDIGKDPDLMGSIEINLADVPIGSAFESSYPVVNAVGYKAQATLDISILIGRNENIIQIKPSSYFEKYTPIKSIQDNPNLLRYMEEFLVKESCWETLPDIVHKTFRDFSKEGYLSYFSQAAVQDMLYDVAAILNPSEQADIACDYSRVAFFREKLKLINSMKLVLESGQYLRNAPIESNSIQINLSADDSKYVVITLQNRFALWTWVAWLRLAYKYWKDVRPKKSLPVWATTKVISNQAKIAAKYQEFASCKVSISLERPYELLINNQEIISLEGMTSLTLAADSEEPKDYKLQIEAIDLNVIDGVQQEVGKGVKSTHKVNKFIKAFESTLLGISSAAAKVGDVAVSTATGVANSTVDAATILATGDPRKMIKGAHGTILEVGREIATTFTTAPIAIFGKSNVCLILKSQTDSFRIEFNDAFNGTFVEFDADELEASGDFLIDHRSLHSASALPLKAPMPLSLEFSLFQGVEKARTMGQKLMQMKRMISFDNSGNINEDLKKNEIELDGLFGEPSSRV